MMKIGDAQYQTFFVRHGMWLGQACAGFALALIAGLVFVGFRRRSP